MATKKSAKKKTAAGKVAEKSAATKKPLDPTALAVADVEEEAQEPCTQPGKYHPTATR